LSLYKAAMGQTHGAPIADDVLPPEQALWQCSNRRPGEMEMCLASTGWGRRRKRRQPRSPAAIDRGSCVVVTRSLFNLVRDLHAASDRWHDLRRPFVTW